MLQCYSCRQRLCVPIEFELRVVKKKEVSHLLESFALFFLLRWCAVHHQILFLVFFLAFIISLTIWRVSWISNRRSSISFCSSSYSLSSLSSSISSTYLASFLLSLHLQDDWHSHHDSIMFCLHCIVSCHLLNPATNDTSANDTCFDSVLPYCNFPWTSVWPFRRGWYATGASFHVMSSSWGWRRSSRHSSRAMFVCRSPRSRSMEKKTWSGLWTR